MNPDKYIFPPEPTSEETLEKLIHLLVADDLDEQALTNPALTTQEHEMHTVAVMLYVTGVELGRIPNGFDHSDEVYLEVRKGVDLLGPQDPMSIMFRIYDEHTNKTSPKTRTWKDSELDELDTENLEEGIRQLIYSFIDYVTEAAHLDKQDLQAFRVAADEFANIEATKSGIMTETNADGVLAIDAYNGEIIDTVSNVIDQFKLAGISPQDVFKSKGDFNQASGNYTDFVLPIIAFETKHRNNVLSMREAATDDIALMEHVLSGIQKFKDLDPLGIALQVFKKAVLDPKI